LWGGSRRKGLGYRGSSNVPEGYVRSLRQTARPVSLKIRFRTGTQALEGAGFETIGFRLEVLHRRDRPLADLFTPSLLENEVRSGLSAWRKTGFELPVPLAKSESVLFGGRGSAAEGKRAVSRASSILGGPRFSNPLPSRRASLVSPSAFHAYRRKRPGFLPGVSVKPGTRTQRTWTCWPRAGLGLGWLFSDRHCCSPPSGKSKAQQTRRAQASAWAPLCCGFASASPGGCADRSSRAADRVR